MFKPGFFGKNPQRWFIGQVPLGQDLNKVSKEKWGDRVKVRIMGYHPKDGNILKDEDLPWAIVLKPTSQGSLNRGSTALVGGEWVIGIFLDDDYEKPMIIGVLGRSNPESEVTLSDQQQQQSTEFNPTVTYSGRIAPTSFQTKGGKKSDSQKPTVPSAKEFGLRT